MTLPERYRTPKTARLAASGHRSDYGLETQSWGGTDQTLGRELRAASAFARPVRGLVLAGDAHIEATRGWSMSLSRFDVSSSVSAAAKGMLMQYECAALRVATWCRITRLVRFLRRKTNCDSSRYSADDRYTVDIIARPGLLSVTESFPLPPKPKAVICQISADSILGSGWYPRS